MHIGELSDESLGNLYRFAALLSGSAENGETLFAGVIEKSAHRASELRSENRTIAMLVRRMREHATMPTGGSSPLLSHPEPLRSAVALKAAALLGPDEIANILGGTLPEIPPALLQDSATWSRNLPFSSELLTRLKHHAHESLTTAKPLSNPILIAGALGIALILGVVIWLMMQKRSEFPGRETLMEIVARNEAMSGMELESADAPMGELGDWFYMRGFEDYSVPASFRSLKAVGGRVFVFNDRPVALIAIEEHHTLGYIFNAEDLGVSIPAHEWFVFTQGEWIAAARQEGPMSFMLAFRGTDAEMREYLKKFPNP